MSRKRSGKMNLSENQLLVLSYLLSNPSYEEAARLSGISLKQLYVWLDDPLFQKELKKRQNDIFWDALLALKMATIKAVNTLISSLDNGDGKIRIDAAKQILSNAGEFYELEERMQTIEGRMANRSKKIVNRQWITRLEAVESRCKSLSVHELLEKWIMENCKDRDWTYLELVNLVPNQLKDVCFRRAMEEVERINI